MRAARPTGTQMQAQWLHHRVNQPKIINSKQRARVRGSRPIFLGLTRREDLPEPGLGAMIRKLGSL